MDQSAFSQIKEMDSGINLPDEVHSMNAYIG